MGLLVSWSIYIEWMVIGRGWRESVRVSIWNGQDITLTVTASIAAAKNNNKCTGNRHRWNGNLQWLHSAMVLLQITVNEMRIVGAIFHGHNSEWDVMREGIRIIFGQAMDVEISKQRMHRNGWITNEGLIVELLLGFSFICTQMMIIVGKGAKFSFISCVCLE